MEARPSRARCGHAAAMAGVVVAAMSLACSRANAPERGAADAGKDAPASMDVGVADALSDAPVDRNDPRCPASADAAAGSCTSGLTCLYLDAVCRCVGYCGGVYLADPPEPTWSCRPLRSDGCPELRPSASTPCSEIDQSCQYNECCIYGYTCTGGTWQAQSPICPA